MSKLGDLTWPRDKYKVNEEYEKITGWPTLAEYYAYGKGRTDEHKVMCKWIEEWDFTTNSALGQTLMDKFAYYCMTMKMKNDQHP